MKVQVRKMTDTDGEFVVEDVHHSFVNALRRTMLAEVPKMAFEDVTVYDNTSALFDELLAHRLGLVPVPTDLQAFVPRAECTCNDEGCSNCTILYTLSKEGPGMVVSGDLTPADPNFKIKDDQIPLVKLLEGQRVMLEAAAIMNTGREHAKYAPVHAVGYREFPHVELENPESLSAETVAQMEKAAPPGVFSFEGGTVKVLDEERAYTFLKSARYALGLTNVKISTDADKFIFSFETDGAITPKDALQRAVAILMEKLKHVESEVTKLKAEEEAAPEA